MCLRPLLIIALFAAGQNLLAFGQTGHRITGQIAERYLTDEARAAIAELIGPKDLAEVTTYPDVQRSNPSEFWQKTSYPWHWITVPDGESYNRSHQPEEGDAIMAIRMYSKQLRDPKASKEHKALALKFIVHLIGDLHQPLHVGNGKDKGGNDFKVEFFWQKSNLHRVWDSGMIDGQQLSFTEWTDWLDREITTEMREQWSSIDPLVWAAESQEIRMGIYPANPKISYRYQYKHLPTLKRRLQQAGVRMAAYLNDLFKG